ncbi:hypothetical protein [endosymbiont of Lamellibrachia barhami]|uniref:hypothetical protein n=1 Tax=endosymbiont of Lamellibrachia barhami TaxID=205975 RepID=UPI0015B1E52C|nr:hypothetical protein [endosymbiont of Lamellibrachia barhami]
MNQCEEDIAVFPRYAIWANTVRDHIGAALVKLEDGETDKARRLLIHAHNSLSAFAEIQKPFDTILD